MAVLVTGGAGYIGSHMVLALTEAGEDVVVLDNLSTGFWWAVSSQAKLIEGDVGDESFLNRIMAEHRFDAVVHFASSSYRTIPPPAPRTRALSSCRANPDFNRSRFARS